MNRVEMAKSAAYGSYLNRKVLKGSPVVNMKTKNTNRNLSMQIDHARHPIPTIWSNKGNSERTIALFDPKSDSSLMNFEQTGSMEMLTNIRRKNKERIVHAYDDLLPNYAPKINMNPNSLDAISKDNKNPYFPLLPETFNNHIPKDAKPTLIDDRMLQHTRDRDFMWESDQIEMARNLLKSPRRKERQERQDESDRRLLGMPQGMDRWDENKNAYIARPSIPKEYLIDEMLSKMDEAQKINSLADERVIHNMEKTALNPIYSYQNAALNIKDQNHIQSGNNDIVQSRYLNKYDYNYREPFEEKRNGILDTITSTIKKFFKKEDYTHKNEKIMKEDYNKYSEYNFIPDPKVSMDRIKNNTTHVIRDGILTIAPDNLDTYGSEFISPVSRMMCMIENGQLHVIQIMDRDRILGSDLNPIGDDLIVTTLPKQYTEKIRNRIHETEGRKIVEMKTDDYINLLTFIVNNPDVQKRVKLSTIRNLLHDNELDTRMIDGYSDNVIILNDELTSYLKEIDASGVDRTGINLNQDKFEMVQNTEDYRSEEFMDGRQTASIRQPLREMNKKYGGRIDDKELDPSNYLDTNERGMKKNHEFVNYRRNMKSFKKFDVE